MCQGNQVARIPGQSLRRYLCLWTCYAHGGRDSCGCGAAAARARLRVRNLKMKISAERGFYRDQGALPSSHIIIVLKPKVLGRAYRRFVAFRRLYPFTR